jgi:succinyl-CoA synthetase beta subunit
VDLFEYQARDLFEKHGVPVLAAAIAHTADEAEAAADRATVIRLVIDC